MGCGSSTDVSSGPARARPARQRPDQSIQLSSVGATSANNSQRYPERTDRVMTPAIRDEFLSAVHRAFGSLDYRVIGGVALAEYGNRRGTSDLDVMVPENISEVVEDQLLSHGMVRTAGGGLGYGASDGRCYGLDITSDRAVRQNFAGVSNSQQTSRTGARLMSMGLLLNSKAWSYMTRAGPDMQAKKANDANDILFIAAYMRRNRIATNSQEGVWVVDYDFWTTFCRDYQGAETALQALGLQRDPTPSPSNRESRNSSMSIRSRASRTSSRN